MSTQEGGYRSRTPEEWLPAAAQCTAWCNRLVGGVGAGENLAVSLGPEAAKEAGTAHYVRTTGEIELNTGVLLLGRGDPEDFWLEDRLWQLRNAPFVGAMAHETAHARYSVAMPSDLAEARWGEGVDGKGGGEAYTRRELDVVFALEESRIEYQLLKRRPELRPFLRRMALEIVNKDFRVAGTRYGASMGAALTVARVDAGSVSREAGKRFGAALRKRLEYGTLLTLRGLWKEYQSLEPLDLWSWPHAVVKRIAAEWIAAVEEDGSEDEDQEAARSGGDLSGSADEIIVVVGGSGGGGSEGSESESEGSPGGAGSLSEELDEVSREESVEADSDLGERAREEAAGRRVVERAVDAERRVVGRAAADKAFRRRPGGGHGVGARRRGARAMEVRAARTDERSAATVFARELARVVTHDKVVTRGSSVLPPGRIRGRGAVLESAQRALGVESSAEPWGVKRRQRVASDKVRVGVLADVSGSMGASEEPLGVMSFVIGAGCAKVGAEYCAVLFGDGAEGVVGSGTRVGDVRVYSAEDGVEMVAPAMQAVDAELGLLDGAGGGARVLIVLTDGHFVVPKQAEYATAFMALCRRRGVTVVWGHWGGFLSNYGYGSVVGLRGKSAAECASLMGKEIVAAVRRNQVAVA